MIRKGAIASQLLLALLIFGEATVALLDALSPDESDLSSGSEFGLLSAVLIGVAALGIVFAARRWMTSGARGVLYLADFLGVVIVVLLVAPWVVYDPASVTETPGVLAIVAVALLAGAFLSAHSEAGADLRVG